jgi:methylmalonyl-CoA/ethylmalonyl-CoA epimerase
MVQKIHHVGIVVRGIDDALRFYRDTLGLPVIKRGELKPHGVAAALLAAGDSAIELVEPTDPTTGVARFLKKRGEGLHHLCFQTEDVGKDLIELRRKGVTLIDEAPRLGLPGPIAFLHPTSTAGVLVELASPTEEIQRYKEVRMKRVVISSSDVSRACDLYRDLFDLHGKSVDGSARALLDVGRGALLIVPAEEAGEVVGMLALSLVSEDLSLLLERLRSHGVALRSGAGELTVEPSSSHGVHLHISRYE